MQMSDVSTVSANSRILQQYQVKKESFLAKFNTTIKSLNSSSKVLRETVLSKVTAEKAIQNTKDFIEDYNKSIDFLKKNRKLSQGVGEVLTSLKSAKANKKVLEEIGISVDTMGRLSVDEDKLKDAMEADSSKVTKYLISSTGLAGRTLKKVATMLRNADTLIVKPRLTTSSSTTTETSSEAQTNLVDVYA